VGGGETQHETAAERLERDRLEIGQRSQDSYGLALTALDAGSREAKIAAALLLIPITYFVAWSVSSWSMLIPVLDIALLALCALPATVPEAAAVEPYQIASTG